MDKEIIKSICQAIRENHAFWVTKTDKEIKEYCLFFPEIYEAICNDGLTIEGIGEFIANR